MSLGVEAIFFDQGRESRDHGWWLLVAGTSPNATIALKSCHKRGGRRTRWDCINPPPYLPGLSYAAEICIPFTYITRSVSYRGCTLPGAHALRPYLQNPPCSPSNVQNACRQQHSYHAPKNYRWESAHARSSHPKAFFLHTAGEEKPSKNID